MCLLVIRTVLVNLSNLRFVQIDELILSNGSRANKQFHLVCARVLSGQRLWDEKGGGDFVGL